MGPGSLDQPTGGLPQTGPVFNHTHWQVQVGDSITAQILGATDADLQGATEADVVIKSSERGNTTVRGTMSGTTITFSWDVPETACSTTIVAYGPVGSNPTGNNSNNAIIWPQGPLGPAGFAIVDGSGNVVDCNPPPPPPPPPPPARCRVPRAIGLRLAAAKRKIRARHCSIGRVRRARSRRALRGRVINQSPRAGAVKRRGFPVKLVVGRR